MKARMHVITKGYSGYLHGRGLESLNLPTFIPTFPINTFVCLSLFSLSHSLILIFMYPLY